MIKKSVCAISILVLLIFVCACGSKDKASSDGSTPAAVQPVSDNSAVNGNAIDYANWKFYGGGLTNEELFDYAEGTGEKCDPLTYKPSCENKRDDVYDAFVFCHPEKKEVYKMNCGQLSIPGYSICIADKPGCYNICDSYSYGVIDDGGCVEIDSNEYFELATCVQHGKIGVWEFSVAKCKDKIVKTCCNTKEGDPCDPATYLNECDSDRRDQEVLITCDPDSLKIVRKSCAAENKVCNTHRGEVRCYGENEIVQ